VNPSRTPLASNFSASSLKSIPIDQPGSPSSSDISSMTPTKAPTTGMQINSVENDMSHVEEKGTVP